MSAHPPVRGPGDASVHSPVRGRGVALAVLAALLVVGCGGSSPAATTPAAGAVRGHGLQGLILRPLKAAPPLTLRNYGGGRVSLASLRGKAVLVTFVYTHCPDVCPLIVANLAAAQRNLGREAARVRILAVTVDPRRDTPAAIRTFLAGRDATGRMDYLLGSRAQLRRAWRDWKVSVVTGRNRVTTGHSSIVYGVTAGGRLAVVYPSNFSPQQIVHDVPLLAGQ